MTDGPSWNDLHQRSESPKASPESADFKALSARLFSTNDGKEWLQRMCAMKFGAFAGEEISNDVLRFREGQRQLLREIQRAAAEGLRAASQAKKPA